jgi:toxin ParE1/3/4
VFQVEFSAGSQNEFRKLHAYIKRKASERTADRYLSRLRAFCRELAIAPHRGERRKGLQMDMRTIGFENRISVIFHTDDRAQLVTIIGIRYAGRSLDVQN